MLGIGPAGLLTLMLACSWRQLGYWQTNRALWGHSLALDPNSATIHCLLGTILENDAQDEQAAVAEYRRAIELAPGQRNLYAWARAKACERLAEIAESKGDASGAIELYQRAIDFDPTYLQTYINFGSLLASLGRLDEAIVKFERRQQLDRHGSPAALCNLATVLVQQGQDERAMTCYREALKLDPKLFLAHVNLAHCSWRKMGNWTRRPSTSAEPSIWIATLPWFTCNWPSYYANKAGSPRPSKSTGSGSAPAGAWPRH